LYSKANDPNLKFVELPLITLFSNKVSFPFLFRLAFLKLINTLVKSVFAVTFSLVDFKL